ncbi:MAG: heme exporter protein CcmD [Pseudomonadota bacterium]|nr:heme exporter protein CcmD [Pseudomonadota bacterium]
MNLGSHSHFIIAAYMAVLMIIGALIAWIVLDYWALKRALGELEESGMTRRSKKNANPPS